MLEEAKGRLDNGLAPTDDCEREWMRMQSNKMRRQQEK